MTHRGPFQPLPFCDSVIWVCWLQTGTWIFYRWISPGTMSLPGEALPTSGSPNREVTSAGHQLRPGLVPLAEAAALRAACEASCQPPSQRGSADLHSPFRTSSVLRTVEQREPVFKPQNNQENSLTSSWRHHVHKN